MRARSTAPPSRIAARPRSIRGLVAGLVLVSGSVLTAAPVGPAAATGDSNSRDLVVFEATPRSGAGFALGGDLVANRPAALRAIAAAGGEGGRGPVPADRGDGRGVLRSPVASRVGGSALVAGVAADLAWKGIPSEPPAPVATATPAARATAAAARGPEQTTDPLEA
jgi:hypothetical protein